MKIVAFGDFIAFFNFFPCLQIIKDDDSSISMIVKGFFALRTFLIKFV